MKMKRRLLYPLLLSCALMCAAVPAFAAGRSWETLRTERSDARAVARDSEVEIKTAKNTIVVTCSRAMTVKVYTILGQLVSSDTLPADTSQLHIPGHGVYIVKINSLTVKVAL